MSCARDSSPASLTFGFVRADFFNPMSKKGKKEIPHICECCTGGIIYASCLELRFCKIFFEKNYILSEKSNSLAENNKGINAKK